MVVLKGKCEICDEMCNAIRFQQNFENWTSGNNDIDKFIQDTQLSVHNIESSEVLEWISYHKFENFNYIKKDDLGKVYKANWVDGKISYWDDYNQNWSRKNQNMIVCLKSLDNLKNVTLDFINKV